MQKVKAYQSKIVLFCSLKIYLEGRRFVVLVENNSDRVGQDPDQPDLQVHGDTTITFIEEKGSLPAGDELLENELQDVIDYQCEHSYRGLKFTPQAILLCPSEVYRARRGVIRKYQDTLAVLTYPYPVEDPIKIQMGQGRIMDLRLSPLFDPGPAYVDHPRTIITTVKFLKQEPPVPYSAWTIWQVVWTSVPPFKDDFQVKYSTILQECRAFYPSWISQDTEQITEGRVNDALELLKYVGWVSYEGKPGPQTMILIHFSRGDKLRTETLHFLAKKYLELRRRKVRAQRRIRKGVARVKKPVATEQDSKLTDYLRGP